MDEAVRLLRELRASASATAEQAAEFIQLCDKLAIPQVTIYTMAGSEGWYEMYRAYVFSKRADIQGTVWYYSSRTGTLTVSDANGKNGQPFEVWDPEADLFFDPSLYEGATNMDPVERERSQKQS